MTKTRKTRKLYGTCFTGHGRPLSLLRQIEIEAKDINRIKRIMNTILANACYSDAEREKQLQKGCQLGNLDDVEVALLNRAWDVRQKMTKRLMERLSELLHYEESQT